MHTWESLGIWQSASEEALLYVDHSQSAAARALWEQRLRALAEQKMPHQAAFNRSPVKRKPRAFSDPMRVRAVCRSARGDLVAASDDRQHIALYR